MPQIYFGLSHFHAFDCSFPLEQPSVLLKCYMPFRPNSFIKPSLSSQPKALSPLCSESIYFSFSFDISHFILYFLVIYTHSLSCLLNLKLIKNRLCFCFIFELPKAGTFLTLKESWNKYLQHKLMPV